MQDIVLEESLSMTRGLRITSLDDDDDGDAVDEQKGGVVDDVDDDDDEEEEEEPAVLGFVEEPENDWYLLRQCFPSKAGGTPAWLDPINLPSGRSCLCDLCGEPLQFVLQVYAPIYEKESTFHRTIFVFMCLSMSCLNRDQHEQWKRHPEKASRSVKVFRCQLTRVNPFYSSERPKNDGHDKPSGPGATLCNWCGTWKADQHCSSCKRVRYCSKNHQAKHWRSGHKNECRRLSILSESSDSTHSTTGSCSNQIRKGNGEWSIYSNWSWSRASNMTFASNSLWPEFEILDEQESKYEEEKSENSGCRTSLISKEDGTLKSIFGTIEADEDKKSWAAFEVRIAKAPEQILRYALRGKNTKPLWPMSSGRPAKSDIPKCSNCGGPRSFEFQILPQLLYYFNVENEADSLDWATIVIYTCEASCDSNVSYKEEFAWVQLQSSSPTLTTRNI